MSAGERIKERMKALGIRSQNTLAKMAGLSQSGLSTILSGKAKPREDSMEALAKALNCTVADLYDDQPPEPQVDDDVWTLREQLRRDPEIRVLFSAARNASPEHLRAAVAMLKALKDNEHGDD